MMHCSQGHPRAQLSIFHQLKSAWCWCGRPQRHCGTSAGPGEQGQLLHSLIYFCSSCGVLKVSYTLAANSFTWSFINKSWNHRERRGEDERPDLLSFFCPDGELIRVKVGVRGYVGMVRIRSESYPGPPKTEDERCVFLPGWSDWESRCRWCWSARSWWGWS